MEIQLIIPPVYNFPGCPCFHRQVLGSEVQRPDLRLEFSTSSLAHSSVPHAPQLSPRTARRWQSSACTHQRTIPGMEGMRQDKDSVIPGTAPCSQGCCCWDPSHAQAGCSHTESTKVTSSYPSPQLSCLKSISYNKCSNTNR